LSYKVPLSTANKEVEGEEIIVGVLQNGHFLQEDKSPIGPINPSITSPPDSSCSIGLGKAGALIPTPQPLSSDVLTRNAGKHQFITAFTTNTPKTLQIQTLHGKEMVRQVFLGNTPSRGGLFSLGLICQALTASLVPYGCRVFFS